MLTLQVRNVSKWPYLTILGIHPTIHPMPAWNSSTLSPHPLSSGNPHGHQAMTVSYISLASVPPSTSHPQWPPQNHCLPMIAPSITLLVEEKKLLYWLHLDSRKIHLKSKVYSIPEYDTVYWEFLTTHKFYNFICNKNNKLFYISTKH